MKKTKQAYHYKYFERKNQIPYFSKNCSIPCTYILSLDNGDTITNPYDIVNIFNPYDILNIFNIYFASIAEIRKKA